MSAKFLITILTVFTVIVQYGYSAGVYWIPSHTLPEGIEKRALKRQSEFRRQISPEMCEFYEHLRNLVEDFGAKETTFRSRLEYEAPQIFRILDNAAINCRAV